MKIAIPDKVSKTAAKMFRGAGWDVVQKPGIDIDECSELSTNADALVVRSYNLHDLAFSGSLTAVGRAGAGVNNIPVEKCTEKGIVVFNTPGANANAVKELVLCGMLLASRKVLHGVNWTDSMKDTPDDVAKLVEQNKSKFKGTEIKGKTLGVIGLGSVGMLIANAAAALDMNVSGYDPYISVDNAWRLSRDVKKADILDTLLARSDYLSLHVPLTGETREMLNKKIFSKMKRGVKIMNFSRGELVNTADLIYALSKGRVDRYVTDFPDKALLGVEGVICIPHLGASTTEAEENCAIMVANQIIDFLKSGKIKNSVNFPDCSLEDHDGCRIIIINRNIPGMIERITTVIAQEKFNIRGMINKSRGDFAYNILDIGGTLSDKTLEKIENIDDVIRVRMRE